MATLEATMEALRHGRAGAEARRDPPAKVRTPVRKLLVEGWRGVNHSFALTNQHQILHMAGRPGLALFHRDLPFALPHWNARDHGAGFGDAARAVIDSLVEPGPGDVPDAVYRICSPFRTGSGERQGVPSRMPPDTRTTTFMVTEVGLSPGCFAPGADRAEAFTQGGNGVVTPSAWARDRVVEYGFPPERVHVVPHGVDAGVFRPLDPAARAANRAALGVAEDETLFVNVGAPLWNKGADLLLRAFAVLRLRGVRARLVVKDQSGLYGLPFANMVAQLGATHPEVLREVVLSGITTVPSNLLPAQLAALLGIADCYVSPYRAEGFNLPALEAVACGVPVIVTGGGATDDFCNDATALRLPGRFRRKEDEPGLVGAYVEPEFDALVDAMAGIADGRRPDPSLSADARRATVERLTWQRAAEETLRVALGS